MERTFAAISTAPYNAALGIVRICGPRALTICEGCFKAASGTAFSDIPAGRAVYGDILSERGEVIDRAVVTLWRAPASATGLDTVEFCCHGGVVVLSRVLLRLLSLGAAAAEPGEFTKAAFLNGKLDLAQSEGVIDLINARSEAAARLAAAGAQGVFSKRVRALRSRLIAALSHISAYVDFSYEDIVRLDESELSDELLDIISELDILIGSYDLGRAVTMGVPCVIAGRPNVGKSSLMNLLAGGERSIVTEISGTTRDVVRESICAGDIALLLSDTAGIRESGDPIERIGIEKTMEELSGAQIILLVLDAFSPLTDGDRAVIDSFSGKPFIAVINKIDLGIDDELKQETACFERRFFVSSKTGEGRETLLEGIKNAVSKSNSSELIVTNARHFDCLKRCAASLRLAVAALSDGEHSDIAEIDITDAAARLSDITGESVREDVITDIFSRFCVGK